MPSTAEGKSLDPMRPFGDGTFWIGARRRVGSPANCSNEGVAIKSSYLGLSSLAMRYVLWTRDRSVGAPGPSSWSTYGARPAILITNASVDPVTSGPAPVANGPSSARSCNPAAAVWLATVKLRRA